MSNRYCDECKDCNKGKTCVTISSDCVMYLKDVPKVSSLFGKNCLSVQDTTEDIYNILQDLKNYNTVDFTALKNKCTKINYNITGNSITQNQINLTFASEICILYNRISSVSTTDIFNVDIRGIVDLKCLSSVTYECDGTSKPIVTFRDLLQVLINKSCE
jgi:hypothetical protein